MRGDGRLPCRRGAAARHHRDDRARARRRAPAHRRPVRGDQGAARRLLRRSTARTSTRRSSGRRKIPGAQSGCDRGAPGAWARRTTGEAAPDRRSVVDRLFRRESGRAVATLDPRPRRLRPRRGGGAGRVRWSRSSAGRATASRDNPARLDRHRRAQPRDRPDPARERRWRRRKRWRPSCEALGGGERGAEREPDPRRPAAADLHLLPPGAGRRGARGADAAHARRADHRRGRARLPRRRAGDGQRLVRAKRKIATPASPTRCPRDDELPQRLPSVLAAVYLIFNEGYAAPPATRSCGASCAPRRSGSARAARRADARRARGARPARADAAPRRAPRRARRRRRAARAARRPGPLALGRGRDRRGRARSPRAAAPGRPAPTAAGGDRRRARRAATDWARIASLYDALAALDPTPVVELNRAVAVAMRDGPRARPGADGRRSTALDGYHLLHAARADLLRRLGRARRAGAYERALELAGNPGGARVPRAAVAGELDAGRRDGDAELATELAQRRPQRRRQRDAVALALGLGARLGLARDEHLVEAGRGRDRLEVAEQPAEQLGGVLAAGEPLDVDGEVEVPDVLGLLALVDAADAVADAGARQHAGEDLDEQRERVALVAAERHGGVDLARVGGRAALLVDAPALGDRAALVARVEDLVDRDLAGGHVGVEDAVGRRRGERDRVGAERRGRRRRRGPRTARSWWSRGRPCPASATRIA